MERYKIIKKLGEGGTSEAYLAKDRKTKRLVTLKLLKKNADKSAKESFEHEADILGKLNENEVLNSVKEFKTNNTRKGKIPEIIDEGDGYIALRYMEGNNLLNVMKEKGTLSEKEALKIAVDVIEIMRMLHERKEPVVYRDLKPSNIIIKNDGHAALIDFGAARFYTKRADVEDTINLGTIGYAAPEQYGSLGQSDEQTDIYCFGMTVLQMLSGANLRDSDALSVLKNRGLRKVTPELFDVIEGCIKADRKLRYKSFREVDDRLKSIPKKRTLRKCMTLVNGFMITAITTLVTTSIIVYAKPIKDAAAYDLDKRLPYVQQRLYIARERLEQYMTVIFTEERE